MLKKMTELPNWVAWKKGDDRKVPINPHTFMPASSTNPNTWAPLDVATRIVENNAGYGLGFVLNDNGIVAIDLDGCIGEGDTATPLSVPFIELARKCGAYVEISPSGKGIHILYYGKKTSTVCKMSFGKQTVEVYDKARYVTYTGNSLFNHVDDPQRHKPLDDYINALLAAYKTTPPKGIIDAIRLSSYASLWEGDTSGYPSHSEADLALTTIIARSCDSPILTDLIFRVSGLYREKWDERRGTKTYGQITIEKAFQMNSASATVQHNPSSIGDKAVPDDYPLTEYGNAKRIVALARDYVYDVRDGCWYQWHDDRGVWCVDETRGLTLAERNIRYIGNIAARMLKLAEEDDRYANRAKAWTKWHARSQSRSNIDSSLNLAARLIGNTPAWDDALTLLNTPGGIVDLETGKVYEWDKQFYMRNQTSIVPAKDSGEPEQFIKFLADITQDPSLVDFFQRLLGYTLIGGNPEQKFFIIWGPGGNGKTTLLNVMQMVLGSYAASTQPETFVARMNAIPSDIARLQGKRFIATSEPVSKGALNAALVKRITGGDTLLVRFMFREWFEMKVVGVPFMTTNIEPAIKDTDDGIWRRIVQIPITRKLSPRQQRPNYDRFLFELEGPKILRWLIRGAQRYFEEGLDIPDVIMKVTENYRKSQDELGMFLEDILEPAEDTTIEVSELQTIYATWCKLHGMRPMWLRTLYATLNARGYLVEDKKLIGYKYTNLGLRLLTQ